MYNFSLQVVLETKNLEQDFQISKHRSYNKSERKLDKLSFSIVVRSYQTFLLILITGKVVPIVAKSETTMKLRRLNKVFEKRYHSPWS